MISVGLVGARGYVGREVVALIEADGAFALTLATSRALAGRTLAQAFEGATGDLAVTDDGPEAVAARGCDAYVLGLPNGHAAPYVAAIEAESADSAIIDLSHDHRAAAFAGQGGWIYGLPELNREAIRGARRIANPGCYATAAILCLWPLRDLIAGTPSAFGISGYSGAGTTPGPKNDPKRLADNILPYGFGGHGHQAEIASAIGHPVAFAPHVASFFRGLIVTCTAPLAEDASLKAALDRYEAAYADSEAVRVQTEPPEPRQAAGTIEAILGGAAFHEETRTLTVSCTLDNLLKGAASQAMENLRLAFA